MTKEIITIPFKPVSYGEGPDNLTMGSESWTAQTIEYQTELACTPSEIEFIGGPYRFTTNKCTYSINPLLHLNGTQNMMYIRFANGNAISNYHLDSALCNDWNLFLALWAKSRNTHNKSAGLDLNALY